MFTIKCYFSSNNNLIYHHHHHHALLSHLYRCMVAPRCLRFMQGTGHKHVGPPWCYYFMSFWAFLLILCLGTTWSLNNFSGQGQTISVTFVEVGSQDLEVDAYSLLPREAISTLSLIFTREIHLSNGPVIMQKTCMYDPLSSALSTHLHILAHYKGR